MPQSQTNTGCKACATLFYCDHHEIPLPAGHRFPIRKYRMLRDRLSGDARFRLEPAPSASRDTVCLAHDPVYVDQFLQGALPAAVMRRIGFPWSEGLVRRTMASAGGTCAAARQALESGFGGTLAGGTHHAFRSEGAGFCVFNDVAIAVRSLWSEGRIRRVAVVDLDVHQGDGTAQLFESEPDVLTVSVHARNNFPFRKQSSKIDVELEDGTGDADYLSELDRVLPRVWDFAPQLVFYLSGVDPLQGDRLGRLALSAEGLAARDRRVISGARGQNVPLVITLGGGYAEPIERTVEAHARTFVTAAEVYGSL